MNKYIKKPVVVEAEELIPTNIIKIVNWITETSDVLKIDKFLPKNLAELCLIFYQKV